MNQSDHKLHGLTFSIVATLCFTGTVPHSVLLVSRLLQLYISFLSLSLFYLPYVTYGTDCMSPTDRRSCRALLVVYRMDLYFSTSNIKLRHQNIKTLISLHFFIQKSTYISSIHEEVQHQLSLSSLSMLLFDSS